MHMAKLIIFLQTMSQALTFVSDMKLGHYMKIPPRAMFWSQIAATVVAGTSQLAVQNWMFNHIRALSSFLNWPLGLTLLQRTCAILTKSTASAVRIPKSSIQPRSSGVSLAPNRSSTRVKHITVRGFVMSFLTTWTDLHFSLTLLLPIRSNCATYTLGNHTQVPK
jgi:hypothetical protein